MSKWSIKKLMRGFAAFGGAYVLGGTILDAIGNALALINWPLTIGGTIAVVCVWLALRAVLKRYPAQLGKYSIKRLNYLPACGLLGFLVLLWTPPLINLVRRPARPAAPVVQGANEASNPKKEVVVLVSEFAGPNPEKYGVTQIILEQLTNAVKGYSDVKIKQLRASIDNAENASAKGKDEGADIVLWGSYLANEAKTRVTIHFEVVDESVDVPLDRDNQTIIGSTANLEGFTLQEELSKQMTYLVLLTVGVARLEAADLAGAITSFSQALATSPAPTGIIEPHHLYEFRGMSYLFNSQLDEAISDFSQVLKYQPDSDMLKFRALAYVSKQQFDEAFQDANKAVQLKANDETYAMRGFIYAFFKNNSKRALEDFEKALALNPQSHSALTNRASIWLEQQKWDLAIQDYEKVLSLDVGSRRRSNAFGGMALAFQGKRDLQNALLNFSRAIEEYPQNAVVYFNRATLYSTHGYPDQALADAEQAVLWAPSKSRGYTVRGNALLAKGEASKAIVDYSKAISLEPNGENTYGYYYNRGKAHFANGDREQALANYDQAIRLKPDFADAYGDRCNVYLNKEEFVRAVSDCDRAISIDPNKSYVFSNRGAALASQGLFARAMSDFEQAIKLDPQNSTAQLNIGLAYKDQGQIDKAIAQFRKVVLMGGKAEVVKVAKQHLCVLARECN